ncbi:gap junction alpha-1 protein-like [Clavelina lepadiformis]|uniref:gap junction alpha-1 protein-like n=1 Tax=Clavelina lepadiformis TaxID=159417 RepID=UPI0040413B5A
MSWNVIEKFTEHVALYGTVWGQAWYLCVFVFRLIVVLTIGSAVYSDEQSAFRCSTKALGCDNVCYDRFAKISHMRFWAFQLLTLLTPVILFHFYTLYVQGQIEKLKIDEDEKVKAQEEAEKIQEDSTLPKSILKGGDTKWGLVREDIQKKIRRRRKSIGRVKERQVYDKTKLEKIILTKGIRIGYLLSVVCRIVIEIVFLYLAYDLFRFAEYPESYSDGRVVSDGRRVSNPVDLFWIRVPQLYRCSGETVRWACYQHMLPGNSDAYVPCWVSRPWEKTIILRYMNTLALVCLIFSAIEFIQLCIGIAIKYNKKLTSKKSDQSLHFQLEAAKAENDYRPAPTNPAPNTQQLPAPSTRHSVDVFHTEVDAKPTLPKVNSAPPAYGTSQKELSNPLLDFRDGKLTLERLRHALKEDEEQERDSKKQLEALYKKGSHLRNLRKQAKTQPGSSIQSRLPYGTQSLNRPKKMVKTGYGSLFRLGSISYSQSEHEDDGDDGGSSGSGSDSGTERQSVSIHSDADLV